MANCENCGKEIFTDQGYATVGRCKNTDCSEYNIPKNIME